MSMAGLMQLLDAARANRYAVGAFNVVTLETAEAIVAAAELVDSPVVLQVSENTIRYHGTLAPIGRACRALADAARVPVALHLDHATSPGLCREAPALGFGSVMFDAGSDLPEENARRTRAIVLDMHAQGLAVEAELDEIAGKDGTHVLTVRTDPARATRYLDQTGADALAIAAGTSHAMLATTARLDLELVDRLAAVLPVPLVLHGSSGVPDDDLAGAARLGVAKINLATQLNQAFTTAVRSRLTDDHEVSDPRRYLAVARDAVRALVAAKLRLLGSAGRARRPG